MQRGSGPTTTSTSSASRGNRQNEKFYKTRLCPNGSLCKKIPRCNYAHEYKELKRSVCLSKTRLCNDLQKSGTCRKGSKCSFAHSLTELYSTADMFKTRLCLRPICQELSCRNAHLPSEIFLVKLLLESGELKIEEGRIRHKAYLDILATNKNNDDILNALIREVSAFYKGNTQPFNNGPSRQNSSSSMLAGGMLSRMDSAELFPTNPLRQLSWTFQTSTMASLDGIGHPSTPNLYPQLSARANCLMSSSTPLYPGIGSSSGAFSLGTDGYINGVGNNSDRWDTMQRTFSSDNIVMMTADRLSSTDFDARSGSSRLFRSSLSCKSSSPGSSTDLGFGPASTSNGGKCSTNNNNGSGACNNGSFGSNLGPVSSNNAQCPNNSVTSKASCSNILMM